MIHRDRFLHLGMLRQDALHIEPAMKLLSIVFFLYIYSN